MKCQTRTYAISPQAWGSYAFGVATYVPTLFYNYHIRMYVHTYIHDACSLSGKINTHVCIFVKMFTFIRPVLA